MTIEEYEKAKGAFDVYFCDDVQKKEDVTIHETGLNIIIDKKSQILILGTFPGTDSWDAYQSCPDKERSCKYYSNAGNQFWKIIADDPNNPPTTDEEKLKLLGDKCIALWDIYKSVAKKSAKDEDILAGRYSDVFEKLQDFPAVKKIFLCGISGPHNNHPGSKEHHNRFLEKFFKDLKPKRKCKFNDLERFSNKPSPCEEGRTFDIVFLPSTSNASPIKGSLRGIWRKELFNEKTVK